MRRSPHQIQERALLGLGDVQRLQLTESPSGGDAKEWREIHSVFSFERK
jgi:hypothetical protein